MFNFLNKSEYLKNITTLVSGTSLAQGISLITAPILYRIYDKEDYGTLGVYMGLCGVIGVFSTMQYLQPILLEKNDNDAKKIMWLNRAINIAVTVFLALFVIVFKSSIANLLNNQGLENWLLLAPLTIFFTGQTEIFRIWANRMKEYKIMSFNAIFTAILVPIVSISFGYYHKGPLGLFLGLLVSQITPSIILAISLSKKEKLGVSFFDYSFIKKKAKEYKIFPIYSLPSEFVNRYTNQLPIFMLSTFTSPGIVGVYNLCVRMLGLPISILGSSIGEVFKQKATEDYNNTGQFKNIFVTTLRNLALVSVIPMVIVLVLGPDLFAFLFGEEWREAGIMARILIGLYIAKLIVSPLSYSFFISKKLKQDFYLHIWMLLSSSVIFYCGFTMTKNYNNILMAYSVNYILIYFIYLFKSFKYSKDV